MDLFKDRPELRQKFIKWLAERTELLESLTQGMQEGGLDEAMFEKLSYVCHDLVGTAGSFGFGHIAEAARVIDDYIAGGGRDEVFIREHAVMLLEVCRRQLSREI